MIDIGDFYFIKWIKYYAKLIFFGFGMKCVDIQKCKCVNIFKQI
jgi:hypothetical protein